MLDEKQIALDCLTDCKTGVVDLTKSILESSNQNLRSTLIQMRNQAEQEQQEIYHIAERIGGYLSSAPADFQHVNRVSSFYRQMWNQPNVTTGYNVTNTSNTVNTTSFNQPFETPVTHYSRY